MENADRNAKQPNPIPGNVPFTKERQPTGEAKSAGWNRRKQAEKIMLLIASYSDMTVQEFKTLIKDIQDHPDKHTMLEGMMVQYITRASKGGGMLIDLLDRNVGKAPQVIEHTGEGGGPITIKEILQEIDGRTKGLPATNAETGRP